jgi:hypothetical protein
MRIAVLVLLLTTGKSTIGFLSQISTQKRVLTIYASPDHEKAVGTNGASNVQIEKASSSQQVNGASSKSLKKEKKRKRSPDFPSFAYRTDSNSQDRTSMGVRFRGDDSEAYQVVRPYRPNKNVVDIPQPEKPDKPLITRLFLQSIGATFEGEDSVLPSSKRTRILAERSYARKEPFAAENITVPPSLDDLASIPRKPFEGFWISVPYRILSFGLSYAFFPVIVKYLDKFVTQNPSELDEVTSKFAPGISILYGTFISLTLNILYTRQRDIQDYVAMECSLLVVATRSLLSLFHDNRELSVEAGQCAADQIRTLVRSSRGSELMLVMYSDPYARMLELIDKYERQQHQQNKDNASSGGGGSVGQMSFARDTLKDLCRTRSTRLSVECQALPPTHFLILNSLTLLILLGFTISIIPTVPILTGETSSESNILFGLLTSIYILFYDFASDLNNPFQGVYQVRRSCAATHLLEAKWLIANHPYLQGEVDFEQVEEKEGNSVEIRTPGLGDFWFERGDLFLDLEKSQFDEN